jgi:hypothetical protein
VNAVSFNIWWLNGFCLVTIIPLFLMGSRYDPYKIALYYRAGMYNSWHTLTIFFSHYRRNAMLVLLDDFRKKMERGLVTRILVINIGATTATRKL